MVDINSLLNNLQHLQQTPHCDISTGKIYGCEKGSRLWWHEKGHIVFNNLQSTSTLKMWQGISDLIWKFTITLSFFNRYMLWICVPMLLLYIGIDVYEEWWCNKYAKEKMLRVKS